MSQAIDIVRAARQSDGSGCRPGASPDECGLKSMFQPDSLRSGSPCTGHLAYLVDTSEAPLLAIAAVAPGLQSLRAVTLVDT
jgi:hypothetical protein